MNTTEIHELRERVRAVLREHGLYENVQLEFDIMAAINPPILPEVSTTTDRREKTLASFVVGMGKNAQMEADWTRLFGTTPNWKTKTGSAFMVWLKERAEHGESLDRFAEWWYENDWRGQRGYAPSYNLVQELWPLAFSEGKRHEDNTRGGFSTPEGL